MTQAIGTYRSCLGDWGEGIGVVYWPTPIFGLREVGLPLRKRDFTQVLIRSIGGLAWINVEPSDFTLKPELGQQWEQDKLTLPQDGMLPTDSWQRDD